MTKPLPPEMRKRSIVDWSEWRIDRLRAMRADGHSASEISIAIGGGATRNAVIGKLHRLGIKTTSVAHSTAIRRGQAEEAATKRAKSEQQRIASAERRVEQQRRDTLSPQALAEHREKRAAAGRAAIAKVDLALIDNPAFVAKVEKPWDAYAHMRTDKGLRDAIAALTR